MITGCDPIRTLKLNVREITPFEDTEISGTHQTGFVWLSCGSRVDE